MKKLFTALLLLVGLVSFSQTTGYFRYDSVRFEKVGGNSEFILLNSTRNVTGGVLTNLGNGRTGFVTPSGSGSGISKILPGFGQLAVNDSTTKNDTTSGGVLSWVRGKKIADSLAALISGGGFGTVTSVSAGYGTAFTTITGSGPVIVDTFTMATRARSKKPVDSLAALIPAQVNLIAGTNVTITGTYPNKTINAAGDANWVFLSDYATPNDGLSDTAGIRTAIATGKNVYVTPGTWLWDGKGTGIVPANGQIIRGYGPSSIIQFTQDTVNVFSVSANHVQIDYITFIGKGRGSTPGAEVFTYSNAIYISGDTNRVQYCNFRAVKGSGVIMYKGATMYANMLNFNQFDSCGVGIYALTNCEYSLFSHNQAYFCRVGFSEYCAGNNTWDFLTSIYNDYGMRILGSSGCNGDHGSVTNFRFNHNGIYGLELRQTNNEYFIGNGKFYNNGVAIGTLDTVYRAIFSGCVYSNMTITTLKAVDCVVEGGTFGTGAVTITGTTGIEFCHIMNSPYETTVCGGGSALTNPMTTAEDIIKGGSSGTPTRLAAGSNGTFLGISGGVVGWQSLPGGGDVSKVGTPVDNQIGVWTGSGTLEGDANFTWTGSALSVTGTGSISTSLTSPIHYGSSSANGTLTLAGNSAASSNTGTNINTKIMVGNSAGTIGAQWDNKGQMGIHTAPADGFLVFAVGLGATGSTFNQLWRNSSSENLFILDNAGSWKLGNGSQGSATGFLFNKNGVGTTTAYAPTAWLDIAASASGNSALRIRNGTAPSSPNEGDIWQASNHLMFRSNDGSTYQLDQQGGLSNPLTTTGDIIYSSSGTTAARLGIGATNKVLQVVGGVPAWGLIVDQGTYAPTVTEVTNGGGVALTTVSTCQYMRVGNVVTVSGNISIDPSATSTFTEIRLTLPIASSLTAVEQVGGTGNATDGTVSRWGIVADATNDAALFQGFPTSSAVNAVSFSFTYLIL